MLEEITIGEDVTIITPEHIEGIDNYHGRTIIIPKRVTKIEEAGLAWCNLKSLKFEKDSELTSIGYHAFEGNNFTLVELPKNLKIINDGAFIECVELRKITIPKGVTIINQDTFHDCHSLTSITIPDSVTSIGEYAFRNCETLKNITIPDSVTTILEGAFGDADR